jgi:hypothetical protein
MVDTFGLKITILVNLKNFHNKNFKNNWIHLA